MTEDNTKPFMFTLSLDFDIEREVQVWRTQAGGTSASSVDDAYRSAIDANLFADMPLGDD